MKTARHTFCSLLFVLAWVTIKAQSITLLSEKQGISFRGLSAVSNNIVWVSGSKGTVGKSVDGGKTWTWITVKGFENHDFRDIEAFDEKTAVIMAIADPAYILRTSDGGISWTTVYENKTKGMFLDAMAFDGDLHGTVVGDPINGKFFVAHTTDGGKTWKDEDMSLRPAADSADGCFASSGTNIRKIEPNDFVFGSAGKISKFYYKKQFHIIPFNPGTGSVGVNSIARRPGVDQWIAVGGDFRSDTLKSKNCFITSDHGQTWTEPARGPGGYRSCVEFVNNTDVITCGLNGVDYSVDGGQHWTGISTVGFNVCRKAKNGDVIFLAGAGGRIGMLTLKTK